MGEDELFFYKKQMAQCCCRRHLKVQNVCITSLTTETSSSVSVVTVCTHTTEVFRVDLSHTLL